MLSRFFYAWERRLASVTRDRVVRPFEWGLDWIPPDGPPRGTSPREIFDDWVTGVMADTDAFFATPPTSDYRLDGDRLTFPSAYETPDPVNNIVHARFFPSRTLRNRNSRCGAVLVLPQWNANEQGHLGLCRLLAHSGLSALRLSLPYHDRRMPAHLHRADFIVSANLGRTVQVCRQAVMDARRGIAWLKREGFERIGILGTSLGSCLAMLTAAHEPLIDAAALNHISPYFADVVWHGVSTAHVRAGLEGHIDADQLRRFWLPISPHPYLERVRGKKILLVYARYDLSFPVSLSRMLVNEFRRLRIPHRVVTLPCGHYSTGVTPFKWVDGLVLTRFLRQNL